MTVTLYGRTATGNDVHRIALHGAELRASVLTYGAVIERLELPGLDGGWTNVVLGLDSLDAYVNRSPHFGAVPGRFANRIGAGRFELDGVAYQLAINDGASALHGGVMGFGKLIWSVVDSSDRHVTLGLVSVHGDAGFPGTLQASVTYTIDGPDLRIDYTARTDRPTVLNLTNHSYFNLGGEGSGSVLDHTLQIAADAFLPVGHGSIPTGEIRPVAGTAFDFREAKPLGRDIRTADEQILRGLGYDHNFVLRPGEDLRAAARLHDPASGRRLDVLTTEPGVQLYTANKLTGALAGPSGRAYRAGDAVCLETQHFPDSPNQPDFPSTVLRPGEVFASTTVFGFSAN